jgi:hypothetical protein
MPMDSFRGEFMYYQFQLSEDANIIAAQTAKHLRPTDLLQTFPALEAIFPSRSAISSGVLLKLKIAFVEPKERF